MYIFSESIFQDKSIHMVFTFLNLTRCTIRMRSVCLLAMYSCRMSRSLQVFCHHYYQDALLKMSKHVRFPSGSFHHSWQFSLVLLTTAMVQQGIYMQKETITWWLVLNSNYKSESTKEKKIAGAMADIPTPWSSTRWNRCHGKYV